MFESRLALELILDHPPVKGGGNKRDRSSQEFPLPLWERARVRGRIISFPAQTKFTCLGFRIFSLTFPHTSSIIYKVREFI